MATITMEAICLLLRFGRCLGLGVVDGYVHRRAADGEVGTRPEQRPVNPIRPQIHEVPGLRAHLGMLYASADPVDLHMLIYVERAWDLPFFQFARRVL